MKRTSIMLPEEVDIRLRREARRRGVPIAEIVREAVESHLEPREPGKPPAFFAIGGGGPADASERVDELVQAALDRDAEQS